MDKVTEYFKNEILRKRSYLNIEMCRSVIESPDRTEHQSDGRIRYWKAVEELGGKYLRVVTLEDGVTLHNAFLDRGYKP